MDIATFQGVIISVMAVGSVAIAGGLFRLGTTLGELSQSMKAFESRLETVERHVTTPPK